MAEQKKKPGRPKGSKNKTTASRSKTTKKSSGNKNSRSAKQAKKGTYGRASRSDKSLSPKESRLRDEIAAIIMLAIGAFFAVSMHTKLAGQVGFFVSQGLKGVFGHGGYILPYFLIIYSILIFFKKNRPIRLRSVVLMTLIFLFMDLLNAERFLSGAKVGFDQFSYIFAEGVALRSGGIFGIYVGELMFRTIGSMGLFIVCIVGILVSTLLLVNTPLSAAYDKAKEKKAERLQKKEELRLRREEALREQEAELAQGQQMTINTSDQDFLGEHVSGFVPVEQKKRNKSIMNLMENDPKYGLNGPSHEEDMAQCFEREKKKKFGLFSNSLGRDESKKDSDAIDFVGGNVGNNEAIFDRSAFEDKVENKNDFSHIENLRAMDDEPPKIKFASDNFSGETFLGEGFAGESLGAGVSGEPKVDLGLKAEDVSAKASVGSKAEDGNAKVKKADVLVAKKELEDQLEDSKKAESKHYVMPPLSLLNIPKRKLNVKNSNQELLESAKMLEETLASFNVKAKVVNVTKGSSVTRYEIQPAVGVKVSSIVRLSDDIALNLKARSIRMEAPIPGKAAVGIEVENESRDMVTISEILSSKEFTSHESKLVFGVGKDISGNPIVSDLGKMPHLLIAGATGSGKSVCINTIIASILYKARPDEVKMVLIDPKMVELGNYNGIPHLLIPVVTDPTKAAAALNWAVAEMTNRYKKFAKAGVRGIKGYNALMEKEGNKEEVLPKIVIIIDELADLMMVASNQVEDAICRLAQLARAAGMHLIVATQRPSVDVITGLIKANIPSRIAFMVSSQIDSRTIIDMPGAEKLVGNGDMLFKPQDLNKPLRIQGPFISDNEVRDLIEFVKSQSDDNVSYDNDMLEQIEKNPSAKEGADEDELLDDAIECVVLAGQASVSMLQRRFRIGYNRAARIIDIMEDRGIVGPQDGSRPRTVNLSQSDLEEMRNLKEEE